MDAAAPTGPDGAAKMCRLDTCRKPLVRRPDEPRCDARARVYCDRRCAVEHRNRMRYAATAREEEKA